MEKKSAPRLKLTFLSEPQYFIQPEKGIVVCKMFTGISIPEDIIELSHVFYGNDVPESPIFETVGIAKKHTDDQWDEVLGKRIAESKAKKKAYEACNKYLNRLVNRYSTHVFSLSNLADEMREFSAHETRHCEDLANGILPIKESSKKKITLPKRSKKVVS